MNLILQIYLCMSMSIANLKDIYVSAVT
jgi:hypothetical protein